MAPASSSQGIRLASWTPPPPLRNSQLIEGGRSSFSPTTLSWSQNSSSPAYSASASSASSPAASDPSYAASCPQYDPTMGHDPVSATLAPLNIAALPAPTPPATPFLTKTYELVDEPDTDSVISWSNNGRSFVVWSPADLCQRLLPRYFKHSNFSSFVRQLNTYGFRKIAPDQWEFAHAAFQRGQKHLLGGIYRRRPSALTRPPPVPALYADYFCSSLTMSSPCSTVNSGAEDEKESLKKDKNVIMRELLSLQQKLRSTMGDLHTMWERLQMAETRQDHMISFICKATQNPGFLAQIQQQYSSVIPAAGNVVPRMSIIEPEKRRLGDVDQPAMSSSASDQLTSVINSDARAVLLSLSSPDGQQCHRIAKTMPETDFSMQAKASWMKERRSVADPPLKTLDELVIIEDAAKVMRSTTTNSTYENVYPYGRSFTAQDGSSSSSCTPLQINQSILRPYNQKRVLAVSCTEFGEHLSIAAPHISGYNRYHAAGAVKGGPPLQHQMLDEYHAAHPVKSRPGHVQAGMYGCFNEGQDTCSTFHAAVDNHNAAANP